MRLFMAPVRAPTNQTDRIWLGIKHRLHRDYLVYAEHRPERGRRPEARLLGSYLQAVRGPE
jgi:hypothetical protein